MAHGKEQQSLVNSLGNRILRSLIGDDIVKARKWVRYGAIAGFVAAGINAVVAIMTVSGTDAEGAPLISNAQFAFVLVEAVFIAALSYGVLKKNRWAAAALLAYFVVSKLVMLYIGLLRPQTIPIQLVFAFLFLLGLRGVLTFHHLTHSYYPVALERIGEEREVLEG